MTEPAALQRGCRYGTVRKVVNVQAPQAIAWRVFTEKMGAWWPLAYYKIGKANAVDAVIEPRVGGRWYERGDDGSMRQWGERTWLGNRTRVLSSVGYQRRLAV